MNRLINEPVHEWMNERRNERMMCKLINETTYEQTNERINERMNDFTIVRIIKWTNWSTNELKKWTNRIVRNDTGHQL